MYAVVRTGFKPPGILLTYVFAIKRGRSPAASLGQRKVASTGFNEGKYQNTVVGWRLRSGFVVRASTFVV